jgi:predicted DNA-binding ribbon-helix-helix protein
MEITKSYWHSDGDRISLSVPFFKVDEERRIVSGFATLDNVDRHNDIVDADASIKAFETFRGNLREMHQPIAVGKVTNFREEQFYDKSTGKSYRGVFVDTYVSKGAQDTWEKVLDGTLSGFSIGGNITKVDQVQKGDDMVRVIKEYELVELSLVDSPANQLANVFSIQKVDDRIVATGIATEIKMDNIFWCETDQIAVAKDNDSSTCLVCDSSMVNIGWVESNDVAKNEEIGKAVDRHILKAAPGSLKVDDFVSWNSSGGMARGKIEKIQTSGSINVPNADVTISAEEEDPAVLIRVYQKASGGWEPSDVRVGHKMSTLRKISDLPEPTDKVAKQADNETNIEGGAVENMEIEKSEEVTEIEETTEEVVEKAAVVAEEATEAEETVTEEASEEEVVEDLEKAANSDVEVEEPDFVKMLEDLKTFFGENISKSAEETKVTVEEITKNIDAQITELAEKHDSLSKAVQNIKSAIDTIEKRVDLVENETAVKKSQDLEGSKEETTIRKGVWSGTFLGVRDL